MTGLCANFLTPSVPLLAVYYMYLLAEVIRPRQEYNPITAATIPTDWLCVTHFKLGPTL